MFPDYGVVCNQCLDIDATYFDKSIDYFLNSPIKDSPKYVLAFNYLVINLAWFTPYNSAAGEYMISFVMIPVKILNFFVW